MMPAGNSTYNSGGGVIHICKSYPFDNLHDKPYLYRKINSMLILTNLYVQNIKRPMGMLQGDVAFTTSNAV